MTALNRQVAERMGYQVVEIHKLMSVPIELSPEYHLIDPDGHTVGGWFTSPEACWKSVPAFDTMKGTELVLRWLEKKMDLKKYFESHAPLVAYIHDFPKVLCEFALEVTKEVPPCPQT